MRRDFNKSDVNTYNICVRNKWLDDVCVGMDYKKYKPKGYWTKEKCQEESLKYKTRKEFKEKSPRAYSISSNHKWLSIITRHMKKK